MTQEKNFTVVARRRWNDPHSVEVPFEALRELIIKNDPGGVCSPIPRPFPYARVWCDQLIDGPIIHACDPETAPHELQLCVLEIDNPPEINIKIRALLRP
jgi:hypothetical protein